MRLLRWLALASGLLSVLLWSASYSWLVGVVPPTQWISRTASPWWVAEVAAVWTGALSLLVGMLGVRMSPRGARRTPLVGAALGGWAMVLSLLSLAMPA